MRGRIFLVWDLGNVMADQLFSSTKPSPFSGPTLFFECYWPRLQIESILVLILTPITSITVCTNLWRVWIVVCITHPTGRSSMSTIEDGPAYYISCAFSGSFITSPFVPSVWLNWVFICFHNYSFSNISQSNKAFRQLTAVRSDETCRVYTV